MGESNRRSRWWALAALSLSFLVVGLDTYVLNTALPTLSAKLGASTSQLQWITDSYILATAALLLPAGKLGDRIGRKKTLMAGLALFGAASVITSLVHTTGELIAMRAVMGAGAAIITPLTMSVLPVMFPADADRRRAVAITTICTMLGMPAGPLLAGWMLTHFAWGSVFLINGPLAALSLIGVAALVPESSDPAVPRLDWAGALLSAAGLTGVIYGIIEQPSHGWTRQVVLALGGGVVLLCGFVYGQARSGSPLIDLRLFASRGFTWGSAAFAVVSFAMTGLLFVLTPYLQIVRGADAQLTGIRLLPMIGAMLASAAVIEKSAARLGVRLVICAGMLICCAGLALLLLAGPDSGYGTVALALAVFGIGLGLSLPLSADAVLATLPPSQAGAGSALNRALQRIAVSLAPAVLGSVLASAYRGSLGRAHAAAAYRAYTHGMHLTALVSIAVLAVTALLVAAFLPGRRNGERLPADGLEESTDPADSLL
ncbi:MAG TPA: MFS transporter [Streptosporangiaceae bacterium]|nr:MFS transporter [Streptosporangiaceae bacterium]